jgi:hypothetical protein
MKQLMAALVCSIPLAAQSTLHTGPGQTFPDIATAIAAAVPGDLVLVHAGTYAPFTLDRGVTIRAEPIGAAVDIYSSTASQNVIAAVPAGQHGILQELVLRYPLDVVVPNGASACGVFSMLDVDCVGGVSVVDAHVMMQDCYVGGGQQDAVSLQGTSTLVATQCDIRGGFSGNVVFTPVYGVIADQQSQVHMSNCMVTGGSRGWVHSTFFGGNGVGMFGSSRGWFVDCTLQAYQSGYAGVGLETLSTVPPVLERVLTKNNAALSPSVVGTTQNGVLLGLSGNTPLVRGSTLQLEFATRPGFPVIAHVSLQLAAPGSFSVVAQPVWGFAQYSLQFAFAFADGQGHVTVPFTIPNSPWLKDLPLWFCGWSEQNLPVQLSPVLGGLIR